MKMTTREITFTGLFAALLVVGAFIKIDIPLPLYTMHFTLQWLFVLLAGYLLGSKLASTSVIIYILIGLCGIPVFAAGGGIGYIFRPGFGFLLGFIVASYLIGLLTELINPTKIWQYILIGSAGMFWYYSIGAVYFYITKNLYLGESVSFALIVVQYCLITVIPDFILVVMASAFAYQFSPIFKRIILARI